LYAPGDACRVQVPPFVSIHRFAVPGGGAPQPVVETEVVDCAERLPAASNATTPSVYEVPQLSPETLKLVDVVVPTLDPLTDTS
jgi:hypothetical protein